MFGYLGHHRAEAGDRTGPEVVAVREAAGQHHRVDATKVGVRVPQEFGLRAETRERFDDIVFAVRTREDDDTDTLSQR
jgi:hypothetical protein